MLRVTNGQKIQTAIHPSNFFEKKNKKTRWDKIQKLLIQRYTARHGLLSYHNNHHSLNILNIKICKFNTSDITARTREKASLE